MSGQFAASDPNRQQGQSSLRRTLIAGGIALFGGLLTAGALVLVSKNAPTAAVSTLSPLAVADVAAATATINPAVSAQLAAEAKNCTVPLAHLTIVKNPGTADGTIRIRSGNYVSPLFRVTDTPQQIAIPFPEPYSVGHGTISVEGSADGAAVSLQPAWRIESLNGSAVQNVVWKPGNPCP
jgi:hypothetical protein